MPKGYLSILAYIHVGALMARTMIELPDDLDSRFREKAVHKFGGRRGFFGKAVKEAIELWLKQQK